jgi:hypothetical protein
MQRGVSSASIGGLRWFARFGPKILLVILVLFSRSCADASTFSGVRPEIAAARCQSRRNAVDQNVADDVQLLI